MGKKAQARRGTTTGRPSSREGALRTTSNKLLLAISGAGMLLTGYMAWTALGGESVKGCGVGSGCDIVLSSEWSTFLGLPTAFWGFLTYSALAATDWIKDMERRWKYAWTISLFGLFYSAYLTTVSLTMLQAACPYCLTSFGLMLAAFIVVTRQRPSGLPNFSWPGWLLKTAAAPVVLILLLHLSYTGVIAGFSTPQDPIAKALADHLNQTGAKFYGASWCPHCKDQKRIFGSAAVRLPYIECSPLGGQSSPTAKVCLDAGVRSYPTWFINGEKIEEVLSIPRLAQKSGFKPPPAVPN
jgi:uncharacterized membrane protein/glutaredoxin